MKKTKEEEELDKLREKILKDAERFKGIDAELDDEDGPLAGPRNDLELQRLRREIREACDDDED
jgi:hypothetical protein